MKNLVCCALLLAAPAAAQDHARHDHGGHAQQADAARQREVAARSVHVMPFSLDRSTHVFEPRSDGGVQTVVSTDRSHDEVALIRGHLRIEAAAFARGDFSDPAAVHGADMPGLRALAAAGRRLAVTYADVPAGGRISYHSDDPAIIGALHQWFAAQVSDHGRHAAGGLAR